MTIQRVNASEGDQLVDVWLRSVRATHTFLPFVDRE
jgi:hypothetical protein